MPRKANENVTKNNVKDEKLNKKVKVKDEISSKVKVPKKSESSSKKVKSNNIKETKTTKKSNTKTASKVSQKSTTTKSKTSSKSRTKTKNTNKTVEEKVSNNNIKVDTPVVAEYYDLPYRYNKTVVKTLAQNPNTLFVYWEISDEDRNNFIQKYGEDFFNITKPVLIIHNLTDKYSFEIDIDDFANNWYIHVNDSKCQYVVELGRRPKELNSKINEDYLYVTSSNMIESPNDHVLFFKDTDKVYFKNIHTNKYTTKVIRPFILNNIKNIYKELNLSEAENKNSFDFNNPSSQNPTSSF